MQLEMGYYSWKYFCIQPSKHSIGPTSTICPVLLDPLRSNDGASEWIIIPRHFIEAEIQCLTATDGCRHYDAGQNWGCRLGMQVFPVLGVHSCLHKINPRLTRLL